MFTGLSLCLSFLFISVLFPKCIVLSLRSADLSQGDPSVEDIAANFDEICDMDDATLIDYTEGGSKVRVTLDLGLISTLNPQFTPPAPCFGPDHAVAQGRASLRTVPSYILGCF